MSTWFVLVEKHQQLLTDVIPAQGSAPSSCTPPSISQSSASATPRTEIMSNESQFKIKSHAGIRLNLPNSFNLGRQPDLKSSASPNVCCMNGLCFPFQTISVTGTGTEQSPRWGWTPNPAKRATIFHSNLPNFIFGYTGAVWYNAGYASFNASCSTFHN